MISDPTILMGVLAAILLVLWLRTAHGRRSGEAKLRSEMAAQLAALRAELAASQAQAAVATHDEAQQREILSMLPVPLFLKDASSRILMMNPACEQTLGVGFAQLGGTRGDHFPAIQQEGFLAADRAAFASHQVQIEEEWAWNPRLRQNRRLLTYKQPVYDSLGRPALLVGVSVDVTERRAAEDALQDTLRQLRELDDHQETRREVERRRVAQSLHDELGQCLMALKLDATLLHNATRARHPRLHAHSARVLAALDGAIHAVRGLINDLHPSTLELGLPAAVDWLLKRQQRRGAMRCQLQLLHDSASASLTPPQTWAIFRMIQEALCSIDAYANATRLDMTLDLRADALAIVISDNGVRDRQAGNRGEAMAMLALHERVSAYGGQLAVTSLPGDGTTISIILPGNEKREAAASRPVHSTSA